MSSSSVKKLPGEVGLWTFILGDLLVFSLFFITYVIYRGEALADYRTAQETLSLPIGTANTLLLLTSSCSLAIAIKALRLGMGRNAKWLVLCTLTLGGLFVAGKATEYVQLVGGDVSESAADFRMFYFVFTGIHLTHILVGLLVLSIFALILKPTDNSDGMISAAECGAIYWHMVDLLWIVLFTLFYLLP
ncbi:MAG: cytochrome c oxidase subunit 3 [Pseudomonadota bacterium]